MSSVERGPLFPQPNDAWVARRQSSLAGEFRRERRRRAQRRLLAAGTVLALALTGTLVGLLGNGGPQPAYAGWSAVPATPTPAQVRAAEGRRACNVGVAPTAIGPIVSEARGPFLSLGFETGRKQEFCITRPGLWTVISFGRRPLELAPDAVTNLQAGWSTPPGDPLISVLAANVGSAITGLRVTLNDGRRIVLTVDHGWAIGWWPGISYPVSARVTAGQRTFSLRPPRPLWLRNHCASLRLLHLNVPCPSNG